MAGDVRVLAGGFSLLEAPRWRDGRLYASDFYTRRVLAFTPDGSFRTVVEVAGTPSGLGWDPHGRLHVVSMNDRKLLRLDGNELVEVADLTEAADNSCNDMVMDTRGRAFVGNFGDLTALGRTRLVRIDPDGTVTRVGDDVFFPNGSCITPDGKTLLVAETFVGRISAFDIGEDGDLSNHRVWAAFAEPPATSDMVKAAGLLPVVPDGMCLDAEGCVWIGGATSRGAFRVREGGQIVDRVETGNQTVIAPMLGGNDGTTLYLCCAAPIITIDHATIHEATLRSCQVDVPGAGQP